MQDGQTRRLTRSALSQGLFLAKSKACLVVVDGSAMGLEYELESPQQTMGRGPGVDFAIPDDAMSREHATVELHGSGFRVRDLDSTNGITLNGRPVSSADLEHGDRIGMGECTLQYVLEKRESVGTYDLD